MAVAARAAAAATTEAEKAAVHRQAEESADLAEARAAG